MVLWTLFRTRLPKKHLFQIRKFAQLDLREVLTLQSSLSAKAAVGASMLCLQSRGNVNFHLVLFESDEQGGDQYASQDMLVQNQLVCFRAQTTITIDYSFQADYHEVKQKLFDVVNYSVR